MTDLGARIDRLAARSRLRGKVSKKAVCGDDQRRQRFREEMPVVAEMVDLFRDAFGQDCRGLCMRAILLLVGALLMGCQPGYVRGTVVKQGERYCTKIENVSQLLDIYVQEKDTNRSVSVLTPASPLKIDVDLDINRTIHRLAEQMNNDVTAIRSVLFTIVVLRNMAPCDEDNIKLSWGAVNNAIMALERHYGEGE